MDRRLRTTLALTGSALAVAGVALAPPASADGHVTTFRTTLLGANEAPGPGDPDGSGTAVLRINGETGRICYVLAATGVAPLRAAHIHEAPAGAPGGIVQELVAPGQGKRTGPSRDCVRNPGLARQILADPAGYYVNVHNRKFPAGALRGQLG